MTVALQQALAQMNQPRQWGRGEGIGNILQSIGAGLQGQRPNWQTQEEQEMERRQRGIQLGLTMQQLQQQGEYQQAQMGHMTAQNRLLAQQAQEYGFKTMDRVAKFYPFVPEEQKEQFLNEWRGVIKDQLNTGLAGDRQAQSLVSNDGFIDYMVKAGAEKGKAFVSSWPFLNAQQRSLVAQQAQEDPKKAIELANVFSQQAVLPHLGGLQQRVEAIQQAYPQAVGQQLPLEDVLRVTRATQVERAALDWWVANEKPEVVTATLSRYGIVSPFTQAEVDKARGIELAKESTPGGQAGIAGKRATTAKTLAEIPYVGVRTVPGQGGLLVNVPPPGQAPLAPVGGGISLGPVPQTPTTQGAGAVPGNVPGAQVLMRTPLPGMSPEAARDIKTQERLSGGLRALDALVRTGDVNNYMGPTMTGAPFLEWSQKNLPAWLVGRVPDGLALMDQIEGDLKNLQIRDITGAAVRESEEPRILSTVPNRKTDKPEVYRAKLRHQMEVQKILERRTKDLLGPDGNRRLDVDADDIARRYPMPVFNEPGKKDRPIDLNRDYQSGDVKIRGPVLR